MSTKESILNKIADYLARRDYSIKEIEEKLAEKKTYDPEKIKEALQKAIDQKWFLPEEELVEKVVSSLSSKNKSYYFISNYLLEKGLPVIPFDESLEINTIQKCLIKKFASYENLSSKDKQKAIQLLSSRGFNTESCYKVLGHSFDED